MTTSHEEPSNTVNTNVCSDCAIYKLLKPILNFHNSFKQLHRKM